jgi:peroxiredoxin
MMALGTSAPDFDLPDANPNTSQDRYRLADFNDADVLVVIFSCNHCPYAKHIEPALVDLARSFEDESVAFVVISANDADRYPEDSYGAMRARAQEREFPFPYLYDESQDVARAYDAACTPDLYVFDKDRTLVYRGRFDETRPGSGTAHGADLKSAIDALLGGDDVPEEQLPSIGCSIKWKA